MAKKTTIGLIQTKVFDNLNKNIENSVIKIKEAAKKKAKIICLPELFLSPYFCQSENHAKFKLAEKIPGRLSDIYCKLAKELSVVLMISLFFDLFQLSSQTILNYNSYTSQVSPLIWQLT